ncbi:MAG TPA: hypothetical protein VLH84_02290 [Patescibacteria group bacterium]|nr:hypothetical protein [Patescibacteria group bacterium]
MGTTLYPAMGPHIREFSMGGEELGAIAHDLREDLAARAAAGELPGVTLDGGYMNSEHGCVTANPADFDLQGAGLLALVAYDRNEDPTVGIEIAPSRAWASPSWRTDADLIRYAGLLPAAGVVRPMGTIYAPRTSFRSVSSMCLDELLTNPDPEVLRHHLREISASGRDGTLPVWPR